MEASSPSAAHMQSKNDLSVIQEDVQIEEGCENELEGQRRTIQLMRQATMKEGQTNQKKSQFITQSELEDRSSDLHLSGLNDEQAMFGHLENKSKGSRDS